MHHDKEQSKDTRRTVLPEKPKFPQMALRAREDAELQGRRWAVAAHTGNQAERSQRKTCIVMVLTGCSESESEDKQPHSGRLTPAQETRED